MHSWLLSRHDATAMPLLHQLVMLPRFVKAIPAFGQIQDSRWFGGVISRVGNPESHHHGTLQIMVVRDAMSHLCLRLVANGIVAITPAK